MHIMKEKMYILEKLHKNTLPFASQVVPAFDSIFRVLRQDWVWKHANVYNHALLFYLPLKVQTDSS